jgi:hypothetical protein
MNVPNDEGSDVFVERKHDRDGVHSRAESSKTGQKTTITPAGRSGTGWCSSCSLSHMETHKWLQRVALLIVLFFPAVPAQAHRLDRVRGDSEAMRLLLVSGLQRSPTFKAIVDRLEVSDLIIEVQCGQFKSVRQAGRTMLLSTRESVRYVLVEIACPMVDAAALEILGHELRHALEIASAPWVTDEQSIGKLYTQIGFSSCTRTGGVSEFETADAIEAGERVHHELLHQAASTRRVAQLLTK